MAEWHVSGSESEPEGAQEGAVEFRGLKMPPSRFLELLQIIEKRKSLELDCLSEVRRKERRRRKRHKRSKVHSPGQAKSHEEVSETASEVRSTTSTTECRDTRRPSLSRFDYFHEDFTALAGKPLPKPKKRPPDPQKKEKKLASLDSIVADMRRHKRRVQGESLQDHQQGHPHCEEEMQTSPGHVHVNNIDGVEDQGPSRAITDMFEDGLGSPMHVEQDHQPKLPRFSFGDDDSGAESPTSEMDMKFSVLSQINRVEQLLDAEGLT